MRGNGPGLPTLAAGALILSAALGSADVRAGGWTGCYVGVNAGYAHGEADATDSPYTQGPFAGTGASWNALGAPYETIGSSDSGATGGCEVGCDYQLASSGTAVVAGIVADIGALDLSDTGTSSIEADTRSSFDIGWAGSLRGRLGIGSETWLAYVTGGYAFADIDVRALDIDGTNIGIMDVSGGGTEDGWVVGGGVEHAFSGNWSLSLEYLHYEFDGITATGAATSPAGAFPRFETDLDLDVVRAGVKWRP
jgi:outer membrane immunogenic protein